MKYCQLLVLLTLSLTLSQCVPVSTTNYSTNKKLVYDDVNYEANIGMVQLFPFSENLQSDLENPVIDVGNSNGFYLEFDLFQDNYQALNVKYIHCNADWTPSPLADIRYLDRYNAFSVDSYEYSANTRVPYVKYAVRLPTPKVSGNYLVLVYTSNGDKDIVFSRRALVYDRISRTNGEVTMSSSVKNRNINQQLQFSVSYQGIDNVNPLRDIRVVLLQNHHWETAIRNLQPTLVRHDESYLEYFHFNSKNNFPGRNEYRFFDLRSIDFRGMNVVNVQKTEEKVVAFLGQDKPRGDLAYAQLNRDLNGNYFLVNSDPGDSQLNSEYVDVYFELLTDPVDGEVYVTGRMNNWNLTDDNLMIYDSQRNSYRGKLRLKQGYYDYMYWVDSPSLKPAHFEGNFFQTENNYEILVYYRDPANNFDELIGYKGLKSNF